MTPAPAPATRRRALLAGPAAALALAGLAAVPVASVATAATPASSTPAASSTRVASTTATAASPRAATAAACAGATSSVRALGPAKAAEAVRCLVNLERRAVGLRELRADARLAKAARAHAADMDRRDYFDHVSPGGSSFADRATTAGFRWSAVGENIAAGQTTPRAVVRAWIRSSGHCHNIMSREYTVIGVGAAAAGPAPYGGPTWVQDFGRPRGTKAPGGPAVRCARKPTV